MATFEGYDRRINKINTVLAEYGFGSLEEVRALCLEKGIDVENIVRSVQPIAFDNAVWAYTLGVGIALKKRCKTAADAAEALGVGCRPSAPRLGGREPQGGLGHGNLAAMLLREETHCFCFLAGHESFAAAEGAIGIARTANKVRKNPLQVVLIVSGRMRLTSFPASTALHTSGQSSITTPTS